MGLDYDEMHKVKEPAREMTPREKAAKDIGLLAERSAALLRELAIFEANVETRRDQVINLKTQLDAALNILWEDIDG